MTSDPRIQAMVAYLEGQGCEAMLAVNNGQNLFLDPNVVFVFSGVRPIGEGAVLIERSGRTTLVVTPAWDAERVAAASRTELTLACDDLAQGIEEVLGKARVNGARVVTLGLETVFERTARAITNLLGGSRPAPQGFASRIARVRNAQEIAAGRKAAWIAERGYERMLEVARPGMREYELAAELYCHMKGLGAEDNFLLMSASQHNLAVCAAGHRRLDAGDIILSEITPCYQGQFVQICRTTVLGEPSPVLKEKYPVLQAAMKRGQAAAVPGTKVREVAEAINGVFRAAGYGKYCQPPYMRVRGHGLGITSDLPGDIAGDSEVVLEEGMVFVMHPNQYLPETGYLMCGEPVVITPRGAQSLSAREAELDFIPLEALAA
ncbi:MAG: aminopeptidase P family protein [Burkholderiales bacterium]|nr:aminopeptidase P family protein [Burkholderiales bacterium]